MLADRILLAPFLKLLLTKSVRLFVIQEDRFPYKADQQVYDNFDSLLTCTLTDLVMIFLAVYFKILNNNWSHKI